MREVVDGSRSGRRWLTRGVLPALTGGITAVAVVAALGGPAGWRAAGGAAAGQAVPAAAAPARDTPGVSVQVTGVASAAYQRALQTAQQTKPTVTLVATGGTISGVAQGRETFTNYRSGSINGEDLIAHLQPELSRIADVNVVQFGNAGSSGYSIEQFRQLTLTVEEALETSDGVVVTSGTDTQEEFAYWLDLTVRSQKPVVTTGAMRPWAAPDGQLVFGADGPANLFNAIALAASQATYCYGTVLMLNDEIHAARDVTKTSSYRADTFQTREYGVLGWIDGTQINLGRATPRVQLCDRPEQWRTPFDLSTIEESDLARAEVVYSYQDAGGEAISAYAAAGVGGIVTAGTGAGGISPDQRAARTAAAAEGVVFVTTTRTGSGSVYGGSGNIIAGGDLLPQKARLLLLLGLTFAPGDVDQIRTWFDTIGKPGFAVVRPGTPPGLGGTPPGLGGTPPGQVKQGGKA